MLIAAEDAQNLPNSELFDMRSTQSRKELTCFVDCQTRFAKLAHWGRINVQRSSLSPIRMIQTKRTLLLNGSMYIREP